jgi:hypothetical protein
VNPDCGRIADPVLFCILLESFVCLGIAMLVGTWVRKYRSTRQISTLKMFGLVLCAGLVVDFIMEPGIFILFQLWSYPSPQFLGIPLGHGTSYAFAEIVAGGGWFTS